MEPELLTTFLDEAESTLAAVRGCILPAVHDGSAADIGGPLGLVRSLRSTALTSHLKDFWDGLAVLENELCSAQEGQATLTPAAAGSLLDRLAALEALLGEMRLSAADPDFDVAGFIEASFELLQAAGPVAKYEPEPLFQGSGPEPLDEVTEAAEDEFEIDAEMLEVFATEAEDLLANIETNLEHLAAQPDNRAALWEIRRSAHTYKGAAGIVGLKKQSEMAHRVEDLLDRLSELEAAASSDIFDLLRKSADCMRAMSRGECATRVSADLSGLYAAFDNILENLSVPQPPVQAEQEPSGQSQSLPAETKPAAPPAVKIDRRPAVRVSLERLDDLVKNVRGLVVSRSVFEQLLDDLEQQIDELHNSTRRLQSMCSRLEIDFEASMLSEGVLTADVQLSGPVPGRDGALFDPLEFDRYTEFHQTTRQLAETASDTFSIGTALDAIRGNLENLFDHQRRLIGEMQDRLMQIRMVEFGTIASRLQRTVRVTGEDVGKKAEVTIENGDIEIDTQILDSLTEPLMHLLKNAVVHGIEAAETRRLLGKSETGSIRIRLTSEQTHIVVEVSDDGRGIVGESLKEKAVRMGLIDSGAAALLTRDELQNLIFLPGLTTAEKLTLSAGRGVGMSIVRESIEAKKGTITVKSSPQRGTTFTLRLPLPLAVTNVVLVRTGEQTLAVPSKHIAHIGSVSLSAINRNRSEPEVVWMDEAFRFRHLNETAGKPSRHAPEPEHINILLMGSAEEKWAVGVDEVMKSEDVVIEVLNNPLDSIAGLIGAAILGNGQLVAILDLPALLKVPPKPPTPTPMPPEEKSDTLIMIVDDSPSVRHTTSNVIEKAGWAVEIAKDGLDALEKLRSAPHLPAVILSDIEMPRMNGYELVAAVRENPSLRHIPVIFITSRTGEKHRQKAAVSGATHYLTKPYDEKDLIKTIAGFIDK